MNGADRENYLNQMQSFERRMDTMIALLEVLVKQGEEITRLANKVSEIDHSLLHKSQA